MTDIVDRQTRSRMMAAIRNKNTKPEVSLRKALHARGFRFRLHNAKLQGRPDIVLAKYHVAVFVHGCFWHRHEGCPYATSPATRPEFWQAKFDANVARDEAAKGALVEDGWRVATVWECALRKPTDADTALIRLASWLVGGDQTIEIGEGATVLSVGKPLATATCSSPTEGQVAVSGDRRKNEAKRPT